MLASVAKPPSSRRCSRTSLSSSVGRSVRDMMLQGLAQTACSPPNETGFAGTGGEGGVRALVGDGVGEGMRAKVLGWTGVAQRRCAVGRSWHNDVPGLLRFHIF